MTSNTTPNNNLATALGLKKNSTAAQYAHAATSTLPDVQVVEQELSTDDKQVSRNNLHHIANAGNKILEKLLQEMSMGAVDHKLFTASAELIKALAAVNRDISELSASVEGDDQLTGGEQNPALVNANDLLSAMIQAGVIQKR